MVTATESKGRSGELVALPLFLPAFGLEPPADCPGAFLLPEGLPGAIIHSSIHKEQRGWW